jgi:hypothetical protein
MACSSFRLAAGTGKKCQSESRQRHSTRKTSRGRNRRRVGRDGGYTAKEASACVIVPTVNPDHVTPHSEAFQAVVWHLFVSHPKLKMNKTKWESAR